MSLVHVSGTQEHSGKKCNITVEILMSPPPSNNVITFGNAPQIVIRTVQLTLFRTLLKNPLNVPVGYFWTPMCQNLGKLARAVALPKFR